MLLRFALTCAIVLLFCLCGYAAPPAAKAERIRLANAYFEAAINRNGEVTRLRVDAAGKGRFADTNFARSLKPENWEPLPETRISGMKNRVVIGPLQVWRPLPFAVANGQAVMQPEKLLPGETLAQTFQIPPQAAFDAVSVRLPTWNTKTSGATLRLFQGTKRLARRRITNAVDNAWQEIRPPVSLGPGVYRVEISDPVGQIGWWGYAVNAYNGGQALRNNEAETGDRALRVSARQEAGLGTLSFRLTGADLLLEADVSPSLTPQPQTTLLWCWQTTWTKSGYDCSPKAGVVWSRFFTNTQRYIAAAQLKRRTNAGLSFDNCKWIEMEGTQAADLRLSGENLHFDWEMTSDTLSLHLKTPVQEEHSALRITALPRRDSVPAQYPRFSFADKALTNDANRFFWERAFSYPSPALPAAWFEWMAITRCWVGGQTTGGEMRQLEAYPMTPNGYVHTWRGDPGWPLRPKPTTDTRHADTNARFILACWRYWLWTGDDKFLRRQAARLRNAMRYQLVNLHGSNGLIETESNDVQGRHGDQSNNYWDILPFGHLDAYANTVFYGSLEAMDQMERAFADDAPPLADYALLRSRVREKYNAVFWNDAKGRYIGCVDVEGKKHDYGFTFVNIEALYYGLGDNQKARRIYHWMETQPTSSGKPDTYSRFVFAPRATTIHNPQWDRSRPPATTSEINPWWVSWWKGTPYGEQCQDGGAVLYVSYFDLMVRLRYFGADNAWRRWQEILGRYRLPDRLSGGTPLYTGETPQQENAGQVGVDFPFPESGMVPCFLLYGILGIGATPTGLQIQPHLPRALPFAEVQNIVWRGATLSVHVTPTILEIRGKRRNGSTIFHTAPVSPSKAFILPIAEAQENKQPEIN